MWKPVGFLLFLTSLASSAYAVPPVLNYAGQVSVDGELFDGSGLFKFALLNAKGKATLWSNDGTSVAGSEPKSSVKVSVNGGLYSILLGNIAIDGMGPIDPAIFLENSGAKLRVWFSDGVNGFERLKPDRPFASVPYAFNSESSKSADSVKAGVITPAQLNEQILKYLKPEITLAPQAPGMVFKGQQVTLQAQAEGKFLKYQWVRNGKEIKGATKESYAIDSANKSLHDGNYSVMVSNDFGTVSTQAISLEVENTHTVSSAGIEMIWCPPGTFMMGSPKTEAGRENDETQHQVTLSNGFYLGKYEVTQAQYETVMTDNIEGLNATPSEWSNNNNRPVETVSWNDIQVFLSSLNDIEETAGRLPEGWKYVLPTEAQWEYACRAGTTTKFYWGNKINSSHANYNWDQTWNTGNDFKQTRDVGMYDPNPWGFFDMIGNVSEWVYSWWAVYPGVSQSDPEGATFGSIRVKRGGNWGGWATLMRIADRAGDFPNIKRGNLGFRLAFQKIQPDTANPEIYLTGGNNIIHSQGIPFEDPGVEAHDVRDGNITSQLAFTGTVDVNNTGTYTLTYTVTDAAGNKDTKTRIVTVRGTHTVDLNASVAMDMIWCPPGTFTMGSPTTEAGREADREDEHNVSLTQGFYLGKYEVTQAQYEAVIGTNPSEFNAIGNGNRPIEKVTWTEAVAFCTQLTTQEQAAGRLPVGWAFVLPTESQWEYACRAGTTTMYSWGNDINATRANYSGSGLSQTRDVGYYDANPWGFFDMHGNVWEMTADWYQAAYPTGNPVVDPTGPASGSSRVVRGGSWVFGGTTLRSARRHYNAPSNRNNDIGFRVGFQKSQ